MHDQTVTGARAMVFARYYDRKAMYGAGVARVMRPLRKRSGDLPDTRAIVRALARRYHWIDGALFQQKPTGPEFRVSINRERPGVLVGVFSMHHWRRS